MKTLMLGNEALARGLWEAGCAVASSYPGTPSTEITEYVSEYGEIYSEWAPNEKVALEVAFGASLAGARSFSGMKHVGLNVAADPLFTISYTGINAGLVLAVADDPGMHSSQNEQDSRHYAIAAKVPMLEPSDSDECLIFAKYAYELSEQFDTPVILRTCTRVAHSQGIVDTGEREGRPLVPYVKNTPKYVMMPGFAKRRHPIVEERTEALGRLAEDTFLNRVEMGDRSLGVITSGASYQYVKEVMGESASVLKLGLVNPLPVELIKEFASKVKRLVVVEELDSIIEDHCKKLGLAVSGKDIFPKIDEFSQNLVAEKLLGKREGGKALADEIPQRPPVMCAGCPHRGMFYTFAKNKLNVLGDIGCYTLGAGAPLGAMDTCVCMGASVSSLHGFNKAMGEDGEHSSVAVIGDSTFMHSGITGLADIAYNGSNSTVVILDNSTTGMTGHQENPTTGYNIKGDPAGKIDLEALCRSLGICRVAVIDPYDLDECDRVLKEELAAPEPSVIIARRPCALLKRVKANPALAVDPDKCRSCMSCMKIGCPALSLKDKKVNVDPTLCVGCDVCTQLCKFGAFTRDGKEVNGREVTK